MRRAPLAALVIRFALPFGVAAALAGCLREAPPPLPPEAGPVAASPAPSGPGREVFRLAPAPGGGLAVTGVVSTPEARAVLLAEIGRRWPGRALRADVAVEPGAAGSWVPEALEMLSYAVGIEGGGLLVVAEAGPAGGGTLSLTGRVPSDSVLARIAADAAASVAPPFVVRTLLAVGLAADTTAAADSTGPPPLVVEAAPGAEAAAAALAAALDGAALAFESGTATLGAGADAALGRTAAALAAHPGVRVEVAAPGGASGSASLDRALAARRATALVAALTSRGVDPARLSVADAEAGAGVVLRLRTGD